MTPKLTDRPALTRHRTRARTEALFLHADVAHETQERLSEVNRTFTSPVVVTPFPEFWPGFATVPDADLLDLTDGAHDLVIHALCLHWADDPVGQVVQCRRALAPDGLFMAVCFGGETLRELRAALTAAEAEVTGGLSPRILPMADIRDLGALLSRAGLALPVADADRRTVRYRDALHLMHDLRGMGETSALDARPRRFTRSGVLLGAAARYQADHADAEGRIPATFDLVWLTGWAPHPGQPQPLRPGSATHRLADALRPKD
ncbi:methyltransferase domain-containing protein [Falsirhodobacter halotolerans]|uniref:methyltransferase domain-containing protein n=1 Tax=Falsirhodobacter halotolerans TaxID=1146892 RepID=UPI001FD1AB53|nr:methyltransferase domain-containing protein [Falsirhodobacter halotolerans]MCJ8138330.1 methyltransferase domain-containing protein [Falsirhodobacter halotolerans]